MSDPRRLVEDPATPALGRTLLASTASDHPPDNSRAAAAKRLGLGAAVLLASSPQAGATATVAGAVWWKLGLVALLFGGVTGLAVVGDDGNDEPAQPAPAVVVDRPRSVEPPPPPPPAVVEPTPAAVAEPPPAPPPPPTPRRARVEPRVIAELEPEPAPEPVVEPPPPAPAPVEPAAPVEHVEPRRLAAEVLVLDRARAALRSGDVAAADAALDEHQRDFSDGSLRAEAEVVRIEVLIKRGDNAAARTRANAFISKFPRSPLGKRVRSLLDRLPAEPTKETP